MIIFSISGIDGKYEQNQQKIVVATIFHSVLRTKNQAIELSKESGVQRQHNEQACKQQLLLKKRPKQAR